MDWIIIGICIAIGIYIAPIILSAIGVIIAFVIVGIGELIKMIRRK